jgi:hypothetical protein
MEWFRNRTEARVIIETWRRHYNEDRPHSSLGYRTPKQFKDEHKQRDQDQPTEPASTNQWPEKPGRSLCCPIASPIYVCDQHSFARRVMEQIGTRCLAELEAASHNRSTKHSLRQGVYLAITLMFASMTSHAATWGRQFAYVVQEDVEQAKDYIVRVNVATGVVERRFDLGSGLGGGRLQLRSAAASTALQRVFFVEAFRARLISLDIHSGAVSQFSADNVPTGVVVSPNGAYVRCCKLRQHGA